MKCLWRTFSFSLKCLQINGIHNSIEKKEVSEGHHCVSTSSADPRVELVPTEEKGEEGEGEEERKEEREEEVEATSLLKKRSNPPLLKLELKKAYEFSPGSSLWAGNLPCARLVNSIQLYFSYFSVISKIVFLLLLKKLLFNI